MRSFLRHLSSCRAHNLERCSFRQQECRVLIFSFRSFDFCVLRGYYPCLTRILNNDRFGASFGIDSRVLLFWVPDIRCSSSLWFGKFPRLTRALFRLFIQTRPHVIGLRSGRTKQSRL